MNASRAAQVERADTAFPAAAQELYEHNVPNGNYIDGAFFGTTFPHLYLQTFSELVPPPQSTKYVPRVFGFKVHKVRRDSTHALPAAPATRRERGSRLVWAEGSPHRAPVDAFARTSQGGW